MSRSARIVALALAAVLGGSLTVVVARVLGASTAARNEVVEVVKLQSEGAEREVVARIEGCSANAACAARARAQVRRLRRTGSVRVLRVDGIARVAVASRTDVARVAWKAGDALPVVQCVEVRRTGNPVAGYDVEILSLSAPIGRERECGEPAPAPGRGAVTARE